MASNSIPLTQEFLKECLEYDPDTGVFTWKERPREHFKSESAWKRWTTLFFGKQAGSIDERGYIKIGIRRGDRLDYRQRAHRLVWLYVYGYLPKYGIDHRNGDFKDNRLCNLREADQFENMQNFRKAMKNNKACGLLGVSKQRGTSRFIARIQKDGVSKYLGSFDTPEEAHAAYISKKREIHPFGTI